jgi:hypothetical protein
MLSPWRLVVRSKGFVVQHGIHRAAGSSRRQRCDHGRGRPAGEETRTGVLRAWLLAAVAGRS